MALQESKGQARAVRLKVSVDLLESKEAEKIPTGVAYAFTSGGRLLTQEILDKEGTATLILPAAKVARSVRILVGPEVNDKTVSISELLRRGAEGRFLRINPDVFEPSIDIAVIPDKWLCWLLGLCFVRGTVLKRVDLGGIPVDLPVCNATVEVYEVDPIWIIIPRLPDSVIERLREIILNPPPIPPEPFPLPFPERFFGGPPPSPVPGPGVESAFSDLEMLAGTETIGGAQARTTALRNVSGASELRFIAQTANVQQFREALIDHATLIRPFLCLYFPTLATMDLVAIAKTDRCGHFQTFFSRGCKNPDTPDLYFKVKQRVLPFPFPPVTIYAPTPIACNTRWNYKCGSEVTLYSSHPLARTCSPCPPVNAPNNWVLVMAIGNRPLSLIRGTGSNLAATTTPENLGLTLTKLQGESTSPPNGAPFGGLLRFRLEFDNSLREDLGVKYYRVYYRKGASGDFTPMTGAVSRHYTHEIGDDLVLETYPLGPKVVNSVANLFEIPSALPPVGQWSLPDVIEDTTSAKFNTLDLAPLANRGVSWPEHGKYQIKIDLFDENGSLVDIEATGKDIKYRVPAVTDLTGDIDTDDAVTLGLVVDDDGDGKKSFIMTIHVDNSLSSANIETPTLNTVPASPDCGVLEYDPNAPGSVTMRYTAQHPHGIAPDGFATFRFRLFRGVNELTLPPAPAAPTLPASGHVPHPPADLTNIQTVQHLLGTCTVAGFSQTLHVWATATNGWRRLHEYDDFTSAAFVLAPESEEGA